MCLNRIWTLCLTLAPPLVAQGPPDGRPPAGDPAGPALRALELRLEALQSKLDAALESLAASEPPAELPGARSALTIGGYGESHANFTQASDNDFLDNHRFVAYLGYAFADWIQLHSETELEHSLVEDGNGELSLEQLHLDLTLCTPVGIRLGRFLVPVGITNLTHEPTTFWSVERPTLDRVLIPTTWSMDGVGVFGTVGGIRYQVALGSGLDGSQFNARNGIRDGRLKEQPGINEPALTGRLEHSWLQGEHDLRAGIAGYVSGLDNANRGVSGSPGALQLYAADLQYRTGPAELRAVYTFAQIERAGAINAAFGNGVAARLSGWYIEAGYHVWPQAWRQGKLTETDAVVFARFEDLDTQDKMPAGVAADPAGKRREWTFGLAWFLTPQVVIKGDWQVRDDDTPGGLADLWNLGFGFRF